MPIRRYIEHEIPPSLHVSIAQIRNECFPEAKIDRSYAKQLPHFRYLAFDQDQLVGQMGVDHRMISVGSEVLSIFGIIDLCVTEPSRGHGFASTMIHEVTQLAEAAKSDFLFLIADDHRIYIKNGFQSISPFVSWMRIDEHRNYGVVVERLEDEVMIKQIGAKM
ncbi:MAG: GNAT family N-acetyltransferase, partial [Verrucomicrobiota bacterium]